MLNKHVIYFYFALLMAVFATGCNKTQEQAPAPAPIKTPAPVTPPTTTSQTAQPVEEKPVTQQAAPETTAATPPTVQTEPKVQMEKTETGKLREAMLALAKKSGCLSCHSIERKIVGPAWQDVAKLYKGDASAKQMLIEKVKKGGSGKWNEITNGAKMPPYSPRVKDQDIEALVQFVLSL